jgi:hypothetical protein
MLTKYRTYGNNYTHEKECNDEEERNNNCPYEPYI